MRLFRFDDPAHVDACALLAWYATQTLEPAEQARVDRHVRECVACSREVEELRRLQILLRSEDADSALTSSRQHTHALLARKQAASPPAHRFVRQWRALPGWTRAALMLQSLLLVLPAVMLFTRAPAEPLYHTLSDRSGVSTDAEVVVVVFDADRPQREMRGLLQSLAAHIIDGPNAVGAYTLQVPSGHQAEALSVLRAHPGVLLAEAAPAGSAGQR
jgi:anti-sigma factor RsiW